MTDPETLTRLGVKESDLSRATQALHDAAVQFSVVIAQSPHEDRVRKLALVRLTSAAEDYADAYLRHG